MFLHIIKKEEYNQKMTSGVYKRTSKNRENLSKSLKNSKKAKKYQFKKGKANPAYGRNQKGSLNPNWKGGVTNNNQRLRNNKLYDKWRIKIFNRDKYTCQDCGQEGGYLHAHHIKSFSKNPKLRFKISNGKTLCIKCHEKIHGRYIGTIKKKEVYKYE
jgi:hypothetical protein